MPIGLMGIVIYSAFLCCVFAVTTSFGGWYAYGFGTAIVLVVSGVAGIACSRHRLRVVQALDELAALHMPAKKDLGMLDGALGRCAEVMVNVKQQADFYEGALRELGSPALVCDRNGVILLATQSMLELIQKRSEHVIGKTVSLALYNHEGVSLAEKVLRERQPLVDTLDLLLWDGRQVSVQLFISFVFDNEGEIIGAVSSFIDMSAQMDKQHELEEHRERMVLAGERISKLAQHVASATELLSASADDQAQGAQKQSRQTAAVASAMELMTETVIEVARNATETRGAAEKANESAIRGTSMVEKAVGAINHVADEAVILEQEVRELNSQVGDIGQIIGVINDIADQTNLLALNAAIEAARAGEAGRGFAVVADEVRKLAEKTVDATREVETAIGSIQTRSRNATTSMQATANQVAESTELSKQAGEALQQIRESISGMVERVAEIATAAEQQSAAAEEIMHSVEDIAVIADDADEAAGQAASATRDMAELARDLLGVSQEFRDGDTDMRLREPIGEVKGILPKLTQGYVKQKYGQSVHSAMQEALGVGVFLPTESYPEQILQQMAEFVARKVGCSVRQFFLGLGTFSVEQFHTAYPDCFRDESLKEFYLRMNEIHSTLSKEHKGITPPSFTFEDKGDKLFMNYRSSRGLFDYFEGALLGAAQLKEEKVSIVVKPFDEETARAEIQFLGGAR